MTKKITTIYIDEGIFEEAKKNGINVSRFVEDCLTDFLAKKEIYEDSVPTLLNDEIEKYTEIAKDRENWEKFAIARCSLIKNKTGILITPHKLIHLVNQKLKESDLE